MKKSYLFIILIQFAISQFVLAQSQIRFGGVISNKHYQEQKEIGFLKDIPFDEIKHHSIFYKGDTLDGFDYDFWFNESKKENIQLMVEYQNYAHRQQDDFVKNKYHLEKLPWEIAKEKRLQNKIPQSNYKVAASACGNLDFEDGNLNGWVCSSGYNSNSNFPLTVPVAGIGTAFTGVNSGIYACQDVNIITSAFTPSNDPIVSPVLDPSGGTTSVRLGGFHNNVAWNGGSPMSIPCGSAYYWDDIWSNGEEITKTINVTAANSLLSFDYAVVLNDGGHGAGSQPYFHVTITNTLGVVLSTCTEYYVQAAAGSPPAGFVNSGYVSTLDGSVLYYKSWTGNSINLTPYIGQTIIVEFSSAGCTLGAHCSWAYVDAICSSAGVVVSNPSPCPGQNITLSAPNVVGGSYLWSGPSIVSGGNSQVVTVNGSGTYSVTVTPSQGGLCAYTLNQTVTYSTSPTVSGSATNPVVCNGSSTTLNGSGASTYAWSGGVTNGVAFNPSATGTYTVIGTTAQGCTNTAVVGVTVNPIPTANAGTAPSVLNCTNTSVSLSGSGGGTYSWTGPGILSGASTANPVVNQPGTYALQVTVLGCTSPANNVVVTQDIAPPVVSASASGVLTCSVTSVTLTGSPSSGVSYTWTGAGIVSGANTANPIVNQAGTYVLNATSSSNGCSASTNVSVTQNTTAPTFALGTANTITTTCSAPNATLSGTSNTDPNTVYTWQTPSSTTVVGNPIITSTPGIYTVVVTNTVNGCVSNASLSTATVAVIPDSAIPTATLTATSLSITCLTATVTTTLNSSSSSITYNWSPLSGIVSGANTASPIFNAAGSYSAVITNTNNNCSTSSNLNVVTVTANTVSPVINLTSLASNSGTLNCIAIPVVITPTINPSSNLTYTWSPTTGMQSPPNQASATFTAAGVYVLSVTNTLTGCSFTTSNSANTFTVVQSATTLTANVVSTSTNTTILCSSGNTSVTFTANTNASASSTFIWLPTGTSQSSFTTTVGGNYTLMVVDAATSCTAQSVFTVIDNTTPPPNLSAGGNSIPIPCGQTTTTLLATTSSSNAVTYLWTGPTATSIVSGANTSNPTVAEQGNYTLTATDNATGCVATITLNIVQGNVVANFVATPSTGIAPVTVDFTEQSTGETTYNWTFGNGSPNSNLPNPSTQYVNGGTFTVMLIASAGPCSDTAYATIIIEDSFVLEIPNVFTPNNDSINDVFYLKSKGVKEFELQIFNRWGEKLYEYAGPKASWDGHSPSGNEVPAGTYYYFVKAKGFDGKELEKNGTVNLFR